MNLKKIIYSTALLGLVFLTACTTPTEKSDPSHLIKKLQPIVIQGALPIETDRLAKKLTNPSIETLGGWTFWKGTYQGFPIIISKTRMGMSNSAAATALAIERYKPIAIINQGTSGGHDPNLKVFDVVLGKYTTNINAFKTPVLPEGAGSNALAWTEAFDVLPEDESDPEPIAIRKFAADQDLLAAAHRVKHLYTKGKVVEGTLGSADVWNNELDRIAFFHKNYGVSAEEMEGASVAQIASQFNVPFLGIRVLSNNITNNGKYDPNTGKAVQDYALDVAIEYMKTKQAE